MSESTATDISDEADWQRRVVGRSLRAASQRSIDRGSALIKAAAKLLQRSNGDGFTVQDVADEAGHSLRTLYQYFESKDDLLLAVYEEAQRTYAAMVREAIGGLDDPLERLGGGLIAALRMPEISASGVDRGLARLRGKLVEADPEAIARSQEPVTALMRELVADAHDAGVITTADPEEATYLLLALKASYITSQTLGNDFGVRFPDVPTVTAFSLRGLGVDVDAAWIRRVDKRLRMPERIALRPGGAAKRSPSKGKSSKKT